MSDYIRQNEVNVDYKIGDAWTILSPIEQSIKAKIERLGTPLKDWDISINYGIKTGCNEAFIIDGVKRAELIAQDPKSAEIIRPILRGRDIKRYSYQWADLYLIATFPAKQYNIDDYPTVKKYLLDFGYDRLKQTGAKGARKQTNNKWFETQDSISYWHDFSKQKIIYREISEDMDALIDTDGFFVNNKCYIITGEYLEYLCSFFNSVVFRLVLKQVNSTGGKGPVFINTLKVIKPTGKDRAFTDDEFFAQYHLTDEEISFISASESS